MTGQTYIISEADGKFNELALYAGGAMIITIDPAGRLFWHGREVETDDDFRAAMLDLANRMGPR